MDKKNYIKAVRFERPDYIPMSFHINSACWNYYEHEALFELMESHNFLFPAFKRPQENFQPKYSGNAQKDKPFTDDFGCEWKTAIDGITGTVVGHPLADWADFENYKFPDSELVMGIGAINWEDIARRNIEKKVSGELVSGGLRHGHTFLQLCDIRGYENLMFDFADEHPLILQLIKGLEEFNAGIVRHYLDSGVDVMGYAEDLGMQCGPMLSPEHFLKYIKPSYRRLMRPAQEKGVIIHMHSDGDIRALADILFDGDIDVINIQDLVNGIDWIKSKYAGKKCIELDIDRQKVTVKGTPAQIDELIKTEVASLGSKQGGLMMIYGMYPGVPLENARTLMDAMERYAVYYS